MRHCGREGGRMGGRRGPSPFVAQLLRAPMTVNNIVALAFTHHFRNSAQAFKCKRANMAFAALSFMFAASITHNVLAKMRMKKIRRSVFANHVPGERPPFKEMAKAMATPVGLAISIADLVLAVAFLAAYISTTMILKRTETLSLSMVYSSIGALVAFVLSFIVGLSGVKNNIRGMRQKREAVTEEAPAYTEESSEKERLMQA